MLNKNIKRKAEPMNKSCEAPKVILSNGMRITCTYIPNLQGGTIMDVWATDTDGKHIASRTLVYVKEEAKAAKLHKAINDLKLEIVGYEVGKLAEKNNNDIPKLLEFIQKRYEELKIEKL